MNEKKEINFYLKKSFTLIEVLIAAAILGTVIIAISQVLIGGQKMWTQDLALVELQQNLRIAVQRMSKEIREASSVDILDEGEKIRFSGTEYYLDKNNYQIKKDDGSVSVVAKNINDLQFSLDEGVVIEIEGQKQVGQSSQSLSVKTKVRLRNE